MIKFNQQSQESQGESVKNSLLRAALFDITFLMLIHTIHSFGKEVGDNNCPSRHGKEKFLNLYDVHSNIVLVVTSGLRFTVC